MSPVVLAHSDYQLTELSFAWRLRRQHEIHALCAINMPSSSHSQLPQCGLVTIVNDDYRMQLRLNFVLDIVNASTRTDL